jgi:hypothetical protein
MSSFKNYSMPPERLLVVAGNVLAKCVLEAQRADAKRIFNDIQAGKRVPLVNVRMDDETEVKFDVALDHSEFRGTRLNFRAFRNSLAGLVHGLGENLKRETAVPVFTEERSGAMLFAVPGFTRVEGHVNVMMLSINLREPGCVQTKLLYMDPDQFTAKEEGQDATG